MSSMADLLRTNVTSLSFDITPAPQRLKSRVILSMDKSLSKVKEEQST